MASKASWKNLLKMDILCANFLDKSAYWVGKISLGKIIGGARAPCAPRFLRPCMSGKLCVRYVFTRMQRLCTIMWLDLSFLFKMVDILDILSVYKLKQQYFAKDETCQCHRWAVDAPCSLLWLNLRLHAGPGKKDNNNFRYVKYTLLCITANQRFSDILGGNYQVSIKIYSIIDFDDFPSTSGFLVLQ